jgi:hypothetical protein
MDLSNGLSLAQTPSLIAFLASFSINTRSILSILITLNKYGSKSLTASILIFGTIDDARLGARLIIFTYTIINRRVNKANNDRMMIH